MMQIDKILNLIKGLESMLACYRTQRRPTESILKSIENSTEIVSELESIKDNTTVVLSYVTMEKLKDYMHEHNIVNANVAIEMLLLRRSLS